MSARNCLFILILILYAPFPVRTGSQPATGPILPESDPSSLFLNDRFAEDANDALNRLYNREYEASLERLSYWKNRYPNHPVWLLWETLEAWWPVLVDLENTSNDDYFLQKSEAGIALCNALLDENEEHLDARVIRSIMYGQLARYYSNRYRWYRSFRNARRALRDFFLIEEMHPEIPDLNFGIGMYRYFAAFLVEEYTLARPLQWMLPSGDREEGLELLKKAADNSIFMEPEARFFLGHIYLNFEREPGRALEYLEYLYDKYPDNTYYRRLYIRSLFQLRNVRLADRAISESLEYWNGDDRHEARVLREDLYTIRGQIHYHFYRFDQAESDFLNAVQEAEKLTPFATRSNLVTSLYYLGQISIRFNRPESARYYFRRAAPPDADHPYKDRALNALRQYDLE